MNPGRKAGCAAILSHRQSPPAHFNLKSEDHPDSPQSALVAFIHYGEAGTASPGGRTSAWWVRS
jgi:hypothetical protein